MAPSPPRILLVDDEANNLKALEVTLRGRFQMVSCTSPQAALQELEKQEFAVVISDQRMPSMPGTEFLAQVAKLKPMTTRVILTGYTDTHELMDAINRAEIFRYLTKPWEPKELVAVVQQAAEHYRLQSQNEKLLRELAEKNKHLQEQEQELLMMNQTLESLVEKRTAELQEANERLSELAMTDPLTKALNRRAFFMKFNEELERIRRYKHRLAIAMIDVDHFKAFNDMEGHLCGDEALKKVAQILSGNLRKTDVLCRYGGEEFLLMLPETPIEGGVTICDRLRNTIETTAFQGNKEEAYLTVSIGLASYPVDGSTAEELVKSADQALYEAKQLGRNRVVHQKKGNASLFVR